MGAMEMFSMGLKATGAYCSRALSYKGAEFELKSVELVKLSTHPSASIHSPLLLALPRTPARCSHRRRRL